MTSARFKDPSSWLKSTADFVHLRDAEGHLVFGNRAAQDLFGWPTTDFDKPIDLEDGNQIVDAMNQTARVGRWIGIINRKDKSGNDISLESRWHAVHNESDEIVGYFVYEISNDDRRLFDENLIRAQRMESIGTLAGGVAHDINNVLGPILIGAEMIKRRVEDPWIRKKLESIETSARRGAEIVKQVLDFSRGAEGEKIVVQPRYVLKELVQFAKHTFGKSILIESDLAPDLSTIIGDAAQIRQMLLNLMVNSRDAMPNGGRLVIRAGNTVVSPQEAPRISPAGMPGDYVRIEVEDTGTGISEENLDRIFEPFFTTKVRGRSTGLGLSTSLSIIQTHDGFFGVSSTPGEGTVFSVYLPKMVQLSAQLMPPSPGQTAEPMIEDEKIGPCILIVDDEQMMLEMNADMLESYGFRTLSGNHGGEGMDLFMEDPSRVDLVVTDIDMPVMGGVEMIRRMRDIRPGLPVVAVSGLSEQHHFGDEDETTMVHVQMLQKPYHIDDLVRLIRSELDAAGSSGKQAGPGGDSMSDSNFDALFRKGDSW